MTSRWDLAAAAHCSDAGLNFRRVQPLGKEAVFASYHTPNRVAVALAHQHLGQADGVNRYGGNGLCACQCPLQRFAIVLKCSDTVEVTAPPREKNLCISLDGSESCPFKTTDRLFIKGANKPIRFIRFADQDFFGTITKKLVRKIYEKV